MIIGKPFLFSRIFNIILICLLFLISFSYFLYGYQFFDLRTYNFDEAISAYGAVNILEGRLPYRDFWTFHAPGRFYILAAIFKIFGINLKVACLFAIFILSLTASGIYVFVSKICSKIYGLFAFLLSLAWLKFYIVYNRPGQFAILFYISCLFPLLNYLSSGKSKNLIIAGILTGIIGLFRMDFMIYNFISLFLIVLLKKLNDLGGKNMGLKIKLILKDGFYLSIGVFSIFLPIFVYFINSGGFKEVSGFVLSNIWQKNRHIPLPELKADTLIFYLPLIMLSFVFFKLVFYDLRSKVKNRIFWLTVFLLFSGIFLYSYTIRRADENHFIPTMIPIIALFVLLYYDFAGKLNKLPRFCKGLIWFLSFLICFFLLLYSARPYFKKMQLLSQDKENGRLDINRAKGFYDLSEYAQAQVGAIKYIQSKTKIDDPIFVGNLRHDKLVNNEVMFYFLSERKSATKYYQFEPGFTTTKVVQQKIVSDLIKTNVQYIILCTVSEEICEPNESCKSSGVKELDSFIQNNYVVENTFRDFLILKHR